MLLTRLPGLVDDPESVRPLWEDEDARLTESLEAIERGVIRIEEEAALDLAVVTVPTAWGDCAVTRFTITRSERYEAWVMFRSRPVQPRPDLRILAARLDEPEPGSAPWIADGPGALTPHLRADGSELPPEVVRAEVESFLASAPAAWDPCLVSR